MTIGSNITGSTLPAGIFAGFHLTLAGESLGGSHSLLQDLICTTSGALFGELIGSVYDLLSQPLTDVENPNFSTDLGVSMGIVAGAITSIALYQMNR